MKYSSLSGTVSHVNQSTEIRGRGGRVRSDKWMSFRVDGTPVVTPISASVADGDEVAVAGASRNSELVVMGMHNYTTGNTYREPLKNWLLVVGGAFVLLGLSLLKFLIGIFPILLGAYFLFLYNMGRKTNALLDEALLQKPPKSTSE
ncbi:hypothetical protein [Yoonia sp. BS5-3]|uniref:Uncharacterized protein n=1 Tax=Yoonia phaeophyticola TaxID=3137369 RepID=A0ABZ2V7K3_9RHOB